MLTPEERAKIARENGSKSRGPKSEEGKQTSRRNALKSGAHATTLEPFVHPHSAVLCNEDRQKYAVLVAALMQSFRPNNAAALEIVKNVATIQWELKRLRLCTTMHWHMGFIERGQQPPALAPELYEMEVMVHVSGTLYSRNSPVRNLHRHINELEQRLARQIRLLSHVQSKFPHPTEPAQPAQPIENTEPEPTEPAKNEENEPAIVVTENTPSVLDAYRKQYPNAKIIVLPADNVARGIDEPDDLPQIPRKAA